MNKLLRNGTSIVRPQAVGGDQFHIGKDLAGNFIFTINQASMKMSPAQTHDLACRLLKALGCQVEMVEQQVQPGQKLAS